MAITPKLASRLRDKVTLRSVTDSQDAAGGPLRTYTAIATRKASIEPLNGRELFTAQQVHAEVTVRIRLRYDSATKTLTPKHNILYDGRSFDIREVINPQNRNKEITLICSEDV